MSDRQLWFCFYASAYAAMCGATHGVLFWVSLLIAPFALVGVIAWWLDKKVFPET